MLDRAYGMSRRLAPLLIGLLMAGPVATEELRLVTFGGGPLTGNYYAIATKLCNRINALAPQDIRCSPEATPGSLYNLRAMREGELDFALVQSDWQRDAVLGTGPFVGDGPMRNLRSVLTLFQEAITFVARRDSGIQSLEDLDGKILDVGHPSSGRHATVRGLVDALEISDQEVDFRELVGPSVNESLCNGQIDASLLVVGHPNATFERLLTECGLVILPVSGPRVETFAEANPDYEGYYIMPGTYAEVTEAIPTFSVAATLVVRSDVPDDVVELFTTTLLDNYESLRLELPVLPPGSPMLRRTLGLTAEVHPAAARVFEEVQGAAASN